MNDFMALLTRRQNERELAVALEQRRLLHGAGGLDPRFRQRNPSVARRLWQRLQARLGGGSSRTAASSPRPAGGTVRFNA